MGFLSSITKPFKKIFDVGKDLVGNVVDAVVGDPLGAVSSVGNLVGGFLGNKSQSEANAANQALAQEQFQFQKDYIQNQIQWKMADAKKAGIHPLAALGIQSPGFSSVSSGQTGLDYSWLGDLGQTANYAATKAKSTPEQKVMLGLQIRGMELDNEYKQAQIDLMKVDALASSIAANQALDSPPAPMLNQQEPTGLYTDKPIIRDGWLLDEAGRKISVIPAEAMKSRTEDVLGVEWFPFISSAWRDAKARVLGQKVNGHWWHGLDKGYLPYPPKKEAPRRAKVSPYYDSSYRY